VVDSKLRRSCSTLTRSVRIRSLNRRHIEGRKRGTVAPSAASTSLFSSIGAATVALRRRHRSGFVVAVVSTAGAGGAIAGVLFNCAQVEWQDESLPRHRESGRCRRIGP
jgi:hypothetical protein